MGERYRVTPRPGALDFDGAVAAYGHVFPREGIVVGTEGGTTLRRRRSDSRQPPPVPVLEIDQATLTRLDADPRFDVERIDDPAPKRSARSGKS